MLAHAQTSYSRNFTNGSWVNCSVIEGNFIWLGTSGGLVKMNRFSEAKTFYNIANSGLPSNYITCIAIDNQGVKWIGTLRDLVRFDGNTWTVFHINPERILLNNIQSIAIDSQGVKWISVGNGLLSFNGTSFTEHSSTVVDIEHSDIRSIAIDYQDAIWMGGHMVGFEPLDDLGLVKYDGNNWSWYNHANNQLQSDGISMIKFDNAGGLWVCHPVQIDASGSLIGGGLSNFNGTAWEIFTSINSDFPDDGASAIAFDQQNNKWITSSVGISRFNGSNWLTFEYPDNISDYFDGGCLSIDSQGIKWLGNGYYNWFDNAGLVVFDGTTWQTINPSNSGLSSNAISCMSIDHQNNVWLGYAHFMNSFDGLNWSQWETPDDDFSSIAIDNQGMTWACSGNRLVRCIGNDLNTVYEAAVPLNSVAIGDQDIKWLGGEDYYGYNTGLLIKWDESDATVYHSSSTTYQGNSLDCLAVDNMGVLWFSSMDDNNGDRFGLTSFDGANWTTYTTTNSQMPDNKVNCIMIDSSGVKWIGTDAGLVKITGNTWMIYSTQNSGLPHNKVLALAEDNQSNVWIVSVYEGLYEGGSKLSKLSGNTWHQFQDVLPQDVAFTSLVIDAEGNKWLGSSEDFSIGLLMFNEAGVGIQDEYAVPPVTTSSLCCYPNPFATNLAIVFDLNKEQEVEVQVYNLKGQLIQDLYQGTMTKGVHKLYWNGKDRVGKATGQGIYFLRLTTSYGSEVHKVVHLQ